MKVYIVLLTFGYDYSDSIKSVVNVFANKDEMEKFVKDYTKGDYYRNLRDESYDTILLEYEMWDTGTNEEVEEGVLDGNQ